MNDEQSLVDQLTRHNAELQTRLLELEHEVQVMQTHKLMKETISEPGGYLYPVFAETNHTHVVFFANEQGELRFVNNFWSRITGQTTAEAREDGWLAAIPRNEQERVRKNWRRSVGMKIPFVDLFRVVDSNGDLVWLLGCAHYLRIPVAGEPGYLGIFVDVSGKISDWANLLHDFRTGTNESQAEDNYYDDYELDVDSSLAFNIHKLHFASSGDVDFELEIAQIFMEDLKTRLQTLQRAITSRNWSLIAYEAHLVKGNAAHFGADHLRNLAMELEHTTNEDEIQELFDTLREEATLVVNKLMDEMRKVAK